MMTFWPWLRKKLFYVDWSRRPYRRRLKPPVVAVALALAAGLAGLFGTILFAVREARPGPVSSTGASNPQLQQIADDLNRVASSLGNSTAIKANASASTPPIFDLYSQWRNGLSSDQQVRVREAIPPMLADAFLNALRAAHAKPISVTKAQLAALFRSVLDGPKPRSAPAAAELASIAALLGEQEALLPAALGTAMTHALSGLSESASRELGQRAIDELFDWLDGSKNANGAVAVKVTLTPPPAVKVSLTPPPPVKVSLTPPSPVKVSLTPTSFVWGRQTWEWGERSRFERAFSMAHRGEKTACIREQLVALYQRNRVVRRILGVATPRRQATAACN